MIGNSVTIEIRKAVAGEAARISEIAFAAKAWWGYSDEFMANCRAELSWSEAEITSDQLRTFVCESDDAVIGFYMLDLRKPQQPDLDAMFVLPNYIGKGVGRKLTLHALQQARQLNAKQLTVQSDPNAEGFYCALGAKRIGERQSDSIPGRYLPLLVFALVA